MSLFNRLFSRLGPLAPLGGFFLAGLIIFGLSRVTLAVVYWPRLAGVEHGWWIFPFGVRMDVLLMSMVAVIPTLLLLLLPRPLERWGHPLVAFWFAAWLALFAFLEVATFGFMAEYDVRPNRLFVDFLGYGREVGGLLLARYKTDLAVGFGLTAGAFWLSWRWQRALLKGAAHWGWGRRLLLLPVVVVLLFAGARSSFGHRPANPSTVAFCSDQLVNELGLNSTYALAHALYALGDEAHSATAYGAMGRDEAIDRALRHSGWPLASFRDPEHPTLHHTVPVVQRQRPLNLVIILEESLGAEYVGSLGGLPLTPNLDQLSQEGLWFTDLYATGTRTVRGIEALISDFFPTANRSVVKLGLSQGNFFTLAGLLKQHGYTTEFIYGGESHFDNMAGFFLSNGFDRVVDEPQFTDAKFHGVWGVSDEDLMHHAHQEFLSHGDQPFFSLVLTTSNHTPFDYPDGRIELYEQPAATVNNAIKYADYAIGELFRLAKEADYYRNTVFLVVADHDTRVYGHEAFPVSKFHIPALIIGADVKPQVYSKTASQLDLAPTLLSLMGIEADHPMLGRDLLTLPEQLPGHALMQFNDLLAFREGERLVVHRPNLPAEGYSYRDGKLTPAPLDPELERDALAHIHLPAILYSERLYTPTNSATAQAKEEGVAPPGGG